MRKLIVTEFVSLDGVVEAPGGEPTHPHSGWTMTYGVPELYEFKFKETMEAESLLLGRNTYEGFAAAWPGRAGDEFADKMNAMPKHVATSKPDELEWNASALSLLGDDVASAVRALKQSDGGPILVAGSATLVHTLLAESLIDELRMMVYPVAIGGGLRLFPDDRSRFDFSLDELVQYSSGATLQIYRPAPGNTA